MSFDVAIIPGSAELAVLVERIVGEERVESSNSLFMPVYLRRLSKEGADTAVQLIKEADRANTGKDSILSFDIFPSRPLPPR